MTALMHPHLTQNNYRFVNSSAFQDYLTFLASDAQTRLAQGGHGPYQAVARFKELKFGTLRLPEALGGYGISVEELFKVLISLAEYDSDLPQILRAHFQLTEEILRSENADFKAYWVNEILNGKIIGNAYTEPAGQEVLGDGQYHTKLKAIDAEHFEINGTKIFSTGTLYSDYVAVRVNDATGANLSVIIPTDREGVERIDDWDGIGQRFTASGTTLFKHVKVYSHELNHVPVEQVKFKPFTQLFLHAVIAGNVNAIAHEAAHLVRSRKRTFAYAFHADPKQDPLLLEKVGEIAATAYIIEHAVLKAAQAQDRALATTQHGITDYHLSHQASLEAAMVKVAIEPLALKAAAALFDVTGASSTSQKYHLDRYWRNIRTLSSHNPTNFKAAHIGQHLVNDVDIPHNPYF
ncbi:acyl-CoA dehydrogenase family protein [Acinetobacter sp. B51(2017)]|uniref:acyl-CoA dehydrogenase family protein n=1 Tax=Acinetobacter sp. B51(2017) TaxID=2060938 RepID=UPI000F095E11|nr:acyl-CoA dehydrogenase family protein [Acinetobacter sp. B51(2017)]